MSVPRWTVPLARILAVLARPLTRRRFVVVSVTGGSMLPGLRPGDRVLVRRASVDALVVGALAVSRARQRAAGPLERGAAADRWVIKRVAALPGDPVPDSVRAATGGVTVVPEGAVVLLSDNPRGHDSRRWGLVPAGDLLGPVVARLPPEDGPTARVRVLANPRTPRSEPCHRSDQP